MGQTYCAEKKVKKIKNRHEKPPATPPRGNYFFQFARSLVSLKSALKYIRKYESTFF